MILPIAYHGVGGPLTVSDGASTSLVDRVYRRGMEELGYQAVDCNGESQTGILYNLENPIYLHHIIIIKESQTGQSRNQ